MEHGNLHSLIPLTDFKALLGLDDREDALSCYCLITATYTIEQYCKRRFYREKNTDYLTFTGEYVFTLREYPVRKVFAVWAATTGSVQRGEPLFSAENLVDPKHYYIDTLLASSTRFVASREAMADKARRKQIEELTMLFKAVLEGRDKVMLEMNVTTQAFPALAEGLPAMHRPTISPLYHDSGYAVKIAVQKSETPALIPKLKALGATDIVEYELRKVIP